MLKWFYTRSIKRGKEGGEIELGSSYCTSNLCLHLIVQTLLVCSWVMLPYSLRKLKLCVRHQSVVTSMLR